MGDQIVGNDQDRIAYEHDVVDVWIAPGYIVGVLAEIGTIVKEKLKMNYFYLVE